MLRMTTKRAHRWGWITAAVSVVLPIAAIMCYLLWHNAPLAWLMVAPGVFVWPGATVRMLQRAVSERERLADRKAEDATSPASSMAAKNEGSDKDART